MDRRIILASGSPRRKELLEMLGLKFDIMVDNTPEEKGDCSEPETVVCRLAGFKCDNVAKQIHGEECIIIAADTVVAIDNEILGKPSNEEDACAMLCKLGGNLHFVYTGVCIKDLCTKKEVCFCEKTKVFFKNLDIQEIKDYINTGEPMDKAGSYGIQNLGALFVEKIEGDYFNVVGLPLCKLGQALKRDFGVNLF